MSTGSYVAWQPAPEEPEREGEEAETDGCKELLRVVLYGSKSNSAYL